MITVPVCGILPGVLMLEILIRVPARFLFGLRLVCKSWNALIINPEFALQNLDHNTKQILCTIQQLLRKSVISVRLDQQPHSLLETIHAWPSPELDFPNLSDDCYVAGSINGIICVSSSSFDRGVVFWNPVINHLKVISFPPAKPHDNRHTSISLAFDSLTNDYRIIRLVSSVHGGSRIEIYSSNQDSWIDVDTPITYSTTRVNSSVIVKGVPYWYQQAPYRWYRDQSNFIAAIDPHTGFYNKIEFPSIVKNSHTNVVPFNFRDSLAVLIYLPRIYPNKKYFHVYTLDETCATWNIMYTITPTPLQNKDMCILRCFEDAGKTLVAGWDNDDKRYFLYDSKTDSLCHSIRMDDAFQPIWDECRPIWDECYHHVDSLFSVNGMVPISEEEDDSNHKFGGSWYWAEHLGLFDSWWRTARVLYAATSIGPLN